MHVDESGRHAPLEDLDRRLHRGRRRWLASLFARHGLWAVVAGGSGFALTRLLDRVSVAGVSATAAGIGCFVGGLVVAGGLAWRSTPSVQKLARLADRRLDLRSRLSTARELAGAPTATRPEARALRMLVLSDAATLTARVVPSVLVPPRRSLAPALAVVVFVGIAAVTVDRWPVPTAQDATVASTPRALTASERSGAEDALERLANAVERESAYRDDPYLSALSSALRELASRVAAGDVDAGTLRSETEALLAHLDATTGSSAARTEGDAPAGDDALASELAPAKAGGSPGDADPSDVVAEVARRSEALDAAAAARADRPVANFYLDPEALAASMRDQRAATVARGDGAGEPAGAAQQSTDAAGDAAGEGTQALTGDEAPDEATFESADAVELPDGARTGEGARVQALGEAGEPGADGVGGAVGAGEGAGGGGSVAGRAEEGPRDPARDEAGDWRRDPLDPAALTVARALFAPSESPGEP